MTWTRAQYVAFARREADAVGSARWDDADVAAYLGAMHRREWHALLDTNPDLRYAERSVTLGAAASVALASLTTGTGDLAQTWYKIRQVRNDTGAGGARPRIYREVRLADWQAATTTTGATSGGLWWRAGDLLQCLPGDAKQTLTVGVSHTPTPADRLSDDTATVDWPDGYEFLLVYVTAARMLARGASETSQAADLLALADQERERMYADLARSSTQPIMWRYPDRADEWGG